MRSIALAIAKMPSPVTSTSDLDVHTSNTELYNEWAKTYDTDGNVLPAVDEVEFNKHVVPALQGQGSKGDTRLLEIGCGTGRNTAKLPKLLTPGSTIYAIDVSEAMMGEAKRKLRDASNVRWALLDFQTQGDELVSFVGEPVDIVISTLVLEHVELDAFFRTIGKHLKSGGWAWISTMHPFIGKVTGASFRREDGVKVRGVSTNYEIEEVVASAKRHGLELGCPVVESGVGDDEARAVATFGPRAKKCIGWNIFVGALFIKL
jgi:2-polyprenyl-3-methyl-5-hydroxy-6-metoxy-1,4-benzoquinol methylase